MIDEFQRAPELMLVIKESVDRDELAGSTNVATLFSERISQSLSDGHTRLRIIVI